MSNLRDRLVRLAFAYPELRKHVMPLLKGGSVNHALLRSPPYQAFAALLKKDQKLVPNVMKKIVSRAEDHMAGLEYEDTFSAPDSVKELFDGETSSFVDMVEGDTGEAWDNLVNSGGDVDTVDHIIFEHLDNVISGRDLDNIWSEVHEAAVDAAAEARDPYGYRGLSRRDFM